MEQLVKQVLEEVTYNRKHLEEKIEFTRKDFGEQLKSFYKGLNKDIKQLQKEQTSLGKRMHCLESEMRHTQMAIKATKEELKDEIRPIGARLEDHEERVTSLESTP